MKRIRHILLLFLAAVMISCEMSAPSLPDSTLISYQRPEAPKNLKVESGFTDRINLSWDSVENATGYIVYGARMSEIGEGLKPISVIRSDTPYYSFSSNGVNVDKDQSYVFSVVAMTEFGGSETKTLLSNYSERAEGAFAPNELFLHVVSTNTDLDAYWASPTLYSAYNSGHGYTSLYDATFSLYYSISGSGEWIRVDEGKRDYLTDSININENRLEQGKSYAIRAAMDITHSDGSVDTISSNEVVVTINSNLKPNGIYGEDITVTQGDRTDAISLTWTLPTYIVDVTRANIFFKIYRSEVLDNNTTNTTTTNDIKWTEIIDEVTEAKHNEAITEVENLTFSFLDKTAEPGKKYVYKIEQAISDSNGAIYVQDTLDDSDASTNEAYLYLPEVTGLTGTWSATEAKDSATLKLSTTPETIDPKDLSLKVIKSTHHILSDTYTTSTFDYPEGGTRTETNTCDNCSGDNPYHEYSYSLALVRSDESIYMNFGEFDFGSTPPTLGALNEENLPLFSDLRASDNRHNRIVLSWNERHYEQQGITTPHTYSYSTDYSPTSEGSVTWTPLTLEESTEEGSTLKTAIIYTEQDMPTIYLRAQNGDNSYISPSSVAGYILSVTNDLSASDAQSGEDIILTWTQNDYKEDVTYSYEMSTSDTFTNPETGVIDYQSGTHTINMRTHTDREATYYFRLKASNSSEESISSTTCDTGHILASVKNIKASKGTYRSSVLVTWSEVSEATSYALYRYDSEDNYQVVAKGIESTSFSDTTPNASYPYYAVQAFKGEVESLYSQTEETENNILFDSESNNYGYAFDNSRVTIMGIQSYTTAEGYPREYFTITFSPNKTANAYTIYQTGRETTAPSFSFDITKLVYNEENKIYTNSYTSDQAGYVVYDKNNNTVSANVVIGIVDQDSIAIESVSVRGRNDLASDNNTPSTEIADISGTYRRDLTVYDYIDLYTRGMNVIVSEANDEFGGDWFASVAGSGHAYTVGSSRVRRTTDTIWGENGYIQLSNYTATPNTSKNLGLSKVSVVMTTTTNLSLDYRNGGASGVAGTDPLDKIGTNSDNSTTLSISDDIQSIAKYRSAVINVSNLYVNEPTSGSYTVTIDGGASQEVTLPNDYVISKIL